MWGLIYVGAFLVTFAASAVLKMTWHPLGDKYSVRWDDSVGTVYTDLPYGEGDANKFDLYLPADNSMETYGLVVYLHAGGSPQAYSAIKNMGVTALDCVNGPYEGTLFWRDKERRRNMGLEHSVLTSGETISELLPTYGYRMEHKEGFSYPVQFLDEGQTAQGDPGTKVSVTFSTYKTGVFTYEPETGMYAVEEYGSPYVDGNTDGQVQVKNVLVLRTDVSNVPGDEAGRLKVRTTGTGSGLLFCDGTVQEITWSKARDSAPMTYLTPDGQPARLGGGPSYVNIVSNSAQVTVE